MGKIFFIFVVGFVVVIIGMLLYPTVHYNWAGIDVTGYTDLEKAGMVILSYGFLFWIGYSVYSYIKR